MAVVRIALLVVAGLLGVVATEGGVVLWLSYAPAALDLTGRYFILTLPPVVVLVVVLAALLLWKILAARPLRNALIFSGTYVLAELLLLNQMGNPASAITAYGAIIIGVCAIVFTTFARLVWSRGRPSTAS